MHTLSRFRHITPLHILSQQTVGTRTPARTSGTNKAETRRRTAAWLEPRAHSGRQRLGRRLTPRLTQPLQQPSKGTPSMRAQARAKESTAGAACKPAVWMKRSGVAAYVSKAKKESISVAEEEEGGGVLRHGVWFGCGLNFRRSLSRPYEETQRQAAAQ